MMVDHHFANASQGAIGLISTVKADIKELEHHNLPASATPAEPEAARGKLNFASKGVACHSVGQGRKLGPDMVGVTKRRTEAWLTRWLRSPEKVLESDPDAKAMLKEYNNLPMPNQNLSDAEIRQFIRYFKWADAQPAGSLPPAEPVTDAAPRPLRNSLGRPSDD
jgi:nitrite reductase (NO-forming)